MIMVIYGDDKNNNNNNTYIKKYNNNNNIFVRLNWFVIKWIHLHFFLRQPNSIEVMKAKPWF